MPVVIGCPKCKKKYSLSDKMLGKTVKCTKCETKFRTPTTKPAKKPAPANPQIAKAQAQSDQRANEMRKLGIDGPIHREPDIFAGATRSRPGEADPLANHVVGDPGFSELDQQFVEEEEVAVNPLADMYANPALQQEKVGSKSRPKSDDEPMGKGKKSKRKRKRKSKGKGSFLETAWIWSLAIFLPIFGLSIVLSFLTDKVGSLIAIIALVVVYLVLMAVGIWMLIAAFKAKESALQFVMYLFVPFYAIYFFVIHWRNGMRDPVLAFFALIIALIVGFIALIAGAAMNSEQTEATASMIPWTQATNLIASHLFLF